jgi:6-pyruvoyltetrahydropterin/6-carboxytetrahydropterin synthase
VEAYAPELDTLGRIIDFGVIKEKLGRWIDDNWDHGMILFQNDPLVTVWTHGDAVNQKYFVLPDNPTAENMAKFLLTSVCPHVFADCDITIVKVTLWETENCFAEVSL